MAVAFGGVFQVLPEVKAAARQYFTDPPLEALHHAVGLRAVHQGKLMFDTLFGAELVADILAAGGMLLARQPVS